jgi:hypothetical protein
MNTNTVVLIEVITGIVVLAAVVLFAVWDARQRHWAYVKQQFGPEYEREVQACGSERDAVQYLSEVADRRNRLDIRPLRPAARERYTRRWEVLQSDFVDRPGAVLDEADRLIMAVMYERGYPVWDFGVWDFGDRAELLAADYSQVVGHYRAAHAVRQAHHEHPDASDTERLRQAFVDYRVLFEQLVRDGQPDHPHRPAAGPGDTTAPVHPRRGRHVKHHKREIHDKHPAGTARGA